MTDRRQVLDAVDRGGNAASCARQMCSGRTPSMPPAQSRGATRPCAVDHGAVRRDERRFIGGVPVKRATNAFAGVS
jgi:hypothetical protein